MKKLLSIIVSMAVGAAVFAAEECPVLLNGVFNMGTKQAFSLTTDGSDSSDWRKVGESYEGWKLVAYDVENQVLTVEKDGNKVAVALASAVAQTGEKDMEKALKMANDLMESMQFEKMMDEMMETQKESAADMNAQMIQQMTGQKELDPEYVEFQKALMDDIFGSIDFPRLKQGMAKIYSEEFTEAELAGLLNFYNTPTGKAYTSKQTVIQQRTMEIMAPMMIQGAAKSQQRIMEFEKAQREKRQAGKAAAASAE